MNAFPPPRPIREGSRLAIIAPAGPFDHDAFRKGVEWLRRRYEVSYDESLFSRTGYLAGSDERRYAEIESALSDPDIDGLLAARGGFGTTRLLPQFDIAQISEANKTVIGFSDITALHSLWARAGVRSLHAPMTAALGNAPRKVRKAWRLAVEDRTPEEKRSWSLDPIRCGSCSGRFFGGNLAVLGSLIGTPYEPPLEGTVLFIEDVGERPYRIDRMLTTMEQAGWWDKISGLVLGAFTEGDPGPDGVHVDEVFEAKFDSAPFPVLRGMPSGHIRDNYPLPFGREAQIENQRLQIL